MNEHKHNAVLAEAEWQPVEDATVQDEINYLNFAEIQPGSIVIRSDGDVVAEFNFPPGYAVCKRAVSAVVANADARRGEIDVHSTN